MKEYIEREAFIDAMHGDYRDIELAQNFPAADVVEVVRCRECKYHNKPRLGFCEIHLVRTNGNDFCSYGERKGVNE